MIRPRMMSYVRAFGLEGSDEDALMAATGLEAVRLIQDALPPDEDLEPKRPILDMGVSDLEGGKKAVLVILGPPY